MEPNAARWRRPLCIGAVATIAVAAIVGCAERIDDVERAALSMSEREEAANAALATAESALEAENLNAFDFTDVGNLDELPALLPEPADLATPSAQQAVETAIGSFYDVLDIYAEAGAAPALSAAADLDDVETDVVFSESDEMLVHVELAYLYVLDAVSRIQQAGGDLYEVEKLENSDTGEVYRLTLSPNVDGLTPQEVLALFDDKQRQAVVDAIRLLLDGVVRAGQKRPNVDATLFRESAIYHVRFAGDAIAEVAPQLQEALEEFDTAVDDLFAAGIVDDLEDWGFVIEEMPQ